MTHFFKKLMYIFMVLALYNCTQERNNPFEFVHHTVSTDLPVEGYNRFGTPALADFDNDGDLDYALSVTRKEVYWFEMGTKHQWQKHKVGEIPTGQLGGVACDVDHDGWNDIIVGGYW